MADALLVAESLTKDFDKVRAVDRLSFELRRGSILGFIGPNGAGKTTTMRMLATLELPDGGDAWVDGSSVLVEPRVVRERVGFMSDRFEAYPNLDVLQSLDFFARAYGLAGKRRLDAVRTVAAFCGLDDFDSRPSTGLSKGMGQRLHLAKTLLHDPQLLILDEPASGLDPRARIEFRELLRELAANGKGILISSHILTELSETCDSVLVVEQGRPVVSGTIAEVAAGLKDIHRLVVRVLGEAETAERFFATQPLCEDVVVVESSIEFRFDGDDAAAADLLARAVGAGLRIVEFAGRGADLEDIFMHATRGRLQ